MHSGSVPSLAWRSQVSPLDDVVDTADIFVTTTGNKDIIMASDMAKMKNNAIVGNIGHFDNEIDMAGLLGWPGIKRQNIKPQVPHPDVIKMPPPLWQPYSRIHLHRLLCSGCFVMIRLADFASAPTL